MATLWRLFAMQSNACHPWSLKPYGYKNTKHSCTFADLRHLWVRDSLLCVFICSKISINSNGWLGHLIGSVNCNVTGPLWRHQNAVSCIGMDKSISDTRRLCRTPGCTRQIIVTNLCLFSAHQTFSYHLSSRYFDFPCWGKCVITYDFVMLLHLGINREQELNTGDMIRE